MKATVLLILWLASSFAFGQENILWLGDATGLKDPKQNFCDAFQVAERTEGRLAIFVTLPYLGAETYQELIAFCPLYISKTSHISFWGASKTQLNYHLKNIPKDLARLNVFTLGHGDKNGTIAQLGRNPDEGFFTSDLVTIVENFSEKTRVSYVSDSCFSGNMLISGILNKSKSSAKLCGMTSIYDRVNLGEKKIMSSLNNYEAKNQDLVNIRNESDAAFIRYAKLNNVSFNSGSTLSSENFAIHWAKENGYLDLLNSKEFLTSAEVSMLLELISENNAEDCNHKQLAVLGDEAISPIFDAVLKHLFADKADEKLSHFKNGVDIKELALEISAMLQEERGNMKLIGTNAIEKILKVKAATKLLLKYGTPEDVTTFQDLVECERYNFFGKI